jgi:uncharacterized ferredoxin-like protein
MITRSSEVENQAAKMVAQLMAAAARTAPKGKGKDNLEILIVERESKDKLGEEMRRIKKETGLDFFERDADNIDQSIVVVLIGTKVKPINVPNCGYCGYEDCNENRANNGICAFNTGDLGIAIGSAVSIAADHRCDNRVLFTAGKAGLNLNYFHKEVKIAYGIPLSISGKSPFFDRNK